MDVTRRLSRATITRAGVVLTLLAFAPPPAAAQPEGCPTADDVQVTGAESFQVTCLDDLTTLGNPRIDTFTHSWGGSGGRGAPALNSPATVLSDVAVPGIQIDGWFPDSCSNYEVEHNAFLPSCDNGMRRNGQFVLRIPDAWDGMHLVVGGTPGVRTQFASDIVLSDYVLSQGWAYAAQDKGNTGLNWFRGGADEIGDNPLQWIPGAALQQWATMMSLAETAAQSALESVHGAQAELTYAAGISNGGYQTRLAVEQFPDQFDGGIDWEGTLFTPDGPNLYTYDPPLLRGYPSYAASGDPEGRRLVVHEGTVPPDAEPIWADMYSIYWGSVATTFRPAVDPEYTNYIAAAQLIVPPEHPDAQYDYQDRPAFVRERVATVSNTGDLHGKPFITVHGTLDALLPIASTGDPYAELVRAAGHDDTYRYYVVEGGTHLDPDADQFPDLFRPVLPCFWRSIDALDAWVVEGTAPAPSGFIPFPADTTHEQRANECALPSTLDRVAGGTRVETAAAIAQRTFGVTERVYLAAAGTFADALFTAPLAAANDAPVLLVEEDVDASVVRQLERMGALEAVIVNPDTPTTVDDQLTAMGITATRLADGPQSVAALSVAVARELGAPDGVAYIASDSSFADSLSAAGVAASRGAPLLLTDPEELSPEVATVLTELGITETIVVGGPEAVSDAVVDALPDSRRVAGEDRFATSVAVIEHGLDHGLSVDQVHIATGTNFPDALAAAPMAAVGEWGAKPGGMVLLVHGTAAQNGSPETYAWLTANAESIERVLLIGGEAAITGAVADRISASVSGS